MSEFSMTVQTDELISASNRVKSFGEELHQLAIKYSNDVQSMRSNGAWVGEAAEAYAAKSEAFRKNIDRLIEQIQGMSIGMKDTAQSIAETEAQNVQRVSGLID